jgi:hypothetical protein
VVQRIANIAGGGNQLKNCPMRDKTQVMIKQIAGKRYFRMK